MFNVLMRYTFFFLVLTGCTQREFTEKDLYMFLADSDNGYTQKVEQNGIIMRMTYKPTDILVAQDIKNKKNVSREEVEALRKHYSQFVYFTLSISTLDINNRNDVYSSFSSSFSDFSENVQRFSFRLSEYVYLTDSKGDTTYLSDFNTPRMYGFSKHLESLLVFKRPNSEGEFKIQCRNLASNLGFETFSFREEKLRNEPKLNFTNSSL